MLTVNRVLALLSLVAIGAVGAGAVACGGSADSPQPSAEITNPTTGISVKATIASASLGDSYANVQMAFFASDATKAATVSVVSVALVDGRNGSTVETLSSSSPTVWNGSAYVSWNEQVTPGGDLRASYHLSAPTWSAIDGTDTRNAAVSSYSIPFRLRMTLRIDGSEVTIESGELQREPQVVT